MTWKYIYQEIFCCLLVEKKQVFLPVRATLKIIITKPNPESKFLNSNSTKLTKLIVRCKIGCNNPALLIVEHYVTQLYKSLIRYIN